MSATANYLLHLADNAVVLGQRNAEWCGHGPVIEEDIALANVSLDLIGQARLLYQQAAVALGGDATEDKLAYFRDVPGFSQLHLAGTAAPQRLGGLCQSLIWTMAPPSCATSSTAP